MTRRILPRTLFGQLMVGTILVQVLLLGSFISYTVVSQRSAAEGRTRVRLAQQADLLATACSKQLADGNLGRLRDILELARVSPAITAARLTNLEGKTLAVTEEGERRGLDADELTILKSSAWRQVFTVKSGQSEAVAPVTGDGKPVALLWLEPNPAASQTTIDTVVRVALNYGAFALLANVLPIFLIVRTVARPLHTLRQATRELIRNPDVDSGFPLPVNTTNEAGDLTVSFNTMVRELREQRSGLLETLALLDSLLDNAPIGFAFFDPELRCVRLNKFLANMYDAPAGEAAGRRIADVFPGAAAEEAESYLKQVFQTGRAIRNAELSAATGRTPDTQRSWLAHFYPVRTAEDSIRWVGLIAVEITERLQAEEALRKTEKLAATGRLAASIAHEINNPLEAVTNLLYILRTDESIHGSAMKFVELAQEELQRVSEVTQQTLRFYRQQTSPSRTNLAEALDSVVKLYGPRITSANVTVIKRIYGEPEVFGFSGELRQVFANLVGNALDAMPGGGRLLLSVRRGEGRRLDGDWANGVYVFVTDTGTGMSPETLPRVFEPFFTTKQATGTGLGLWVSEEIIRKHQGTVRVRSRTGAKSWTSFMLFLPEVGVYPTPASPRYGEGSMAAAGKSTSEMVGMAPQA